GSALVQQIAENAAEPAVIPEKVAAILRAMRAAMDQG
ncbi:MAG: tryptophan synthase subunit alpha, partial [Gammaproteobacteria bacterium HGW-Gammaproteobacteria-14]